jgi:hypothetical protein
MQKRDKYSDMAVILGDKTYQSKKQILTLKTKLLIRSKGRTEP